jgi:pyruvate dehydrogenase E1 component
MGLGPISAIYQARFWKYLEGRGLMPKSDRKVWCFLGDGETDEPESLGAISLAGREGLDNLVFVINCNLQRLDGPVRGNGKIIQELEGVFRGAGWNVLKVVWGSYWDPLLARDTPACCAADDGDRRRRVPELQGLRRQVHARELLRQVPGDRGAGRQPVRRGHLAAQPRRPRPAQGLRRLPRGGEDQGQPTVILAKTVKGYGMGKAGESLNPTHQHQEAGRRGGARLPRPLQDPGHRRQLAEVPFYHPGEDSPEVQYLLERREALGGFLPQRRPARPASRCRPEAEVFERLLKASGEREISTTMAFVQALNIILRDKQVGPRCVPIVADEARTFGMEGLFRQIGIYAPHGQKYKPVDADQLMYYREDAAGQVLEEGITEAGAFSSWMAAATSYSTNNLQMLPFYIYYSMFGFQRIGDSPGRPPTCARAASCSAPPPAAPRSTAKACSTRTATAHLLAGAIPNCRSLRPDLRLRGRGDPAARHARMLEEQVGRVLLPDPDERELRAPGDAGGRGRGHHPRHVPAAGRERQAEGKGKSKRTCSCWARAPSCARPSPRPSCWRRTSASPPTSGAARASPSCAATASTPSAGTACTRRPSAAQGLRHRAAGRAAQGPAIAATDYVRAFADQIRAFVPMRYTVLGTDGFGRSDTRANLRRFFEVDRYHIAHAAIARWPRRAR